MTRLNVDFSFARFLNGVVIIKAQLLQMLLKKIKGFHSHLHQKKHGATSIHFVVCPFWHQLTCHKGHSQIIARFIRLKEYDLKCEIRYKGS